MFQVELAALIFDGQQITYDDYIMQKFHFCAAMPMVWRF